MFTNVHQIFCPEADNLYPVHILILTSHLCLDLSNGLFILFPDQNFVGVSLFRLMCQYPNITFDENTNCRVSYCLVFSNLLLLPHFLTQISSSTPYSPNTASVFLKVWESKIYNAQAWGKNSLQNYFQLRSDWMTCFQVALHTWHSSPPSKTAAGRCVSDCCCPTHS